MFDPVSKTAIQYIEALAGLSEFGIRFPYNNNSQTDLNVTGTTNLTARVNRYRDITIGATGVLNLQVSPCFLFARSITIVAGGIISIDGQGAPGGTGGAGEPTSGAGDAGNEGGSGDLGATDPADPPQYTFGISTGGSGGKGSPSFSGITGGRGGRASGLQLGPTTATTSGSPCPDGQDGATYLATDLLGWALEVYKSHRGGGGGGGGQGGQFNVTAGDDGGDGGTGGGMLYICCEEWNNEGEVRARGTAGVDANSPYNGSPGAGGGGGGGLIYVRTARSIADGTFDVSGGLGAACGGGSGGDGGDGGDGIAILNKVE